MRLPGSFLPQPAAASLLGAALALMLVARAGAQSQDVAPPPADQQTLRLRIYWGGGGQHAWGGRVWAEGGRLDRLQRLNVDPYAAATVHEVEDEVRLAPGASTRHNAFDVTLTTGDAERLRVELSADDGETQTFDAPIEALFGETFTASLVGDAGRLAIYRVKEDQLRIDTGRDRLIFAPAETLSLKLKAAIVDAAPRTPLDLVVELRRGRRGAVLLSRTERVETPDTGHATLATEIALPEEEGVYSVRVAAAKPPGLTARFLPRAAPKQLAEREFQVVVFDPDRRRRLNNKGRMLAQIDPTTPRWWERVPRWVWPRRLPRPEQQLGSAPPEVVADAAGGKLVRLPPAPASGLGPWQAYPLPVDGAGKPHLVEVDYPIDLPQTLTVSLLDRDATGRTTPLGASEAVFVDEWTAAAGADGEPSTRTVRRLFWPRTGAPLLLVSNHRDAAARFGKIRVYRLDNEPGPTGTQPTRPADERPVLLSLAGTRPADAFGATRALADDGAFAYEDQQTWYETATRLADAVELGGYNGAVLTVASSQGVLFPSRVFARVPGADRQPLASGAADLPPKDLLELLLLEFDRRGLRLVPAVVFDAALPGVAPNQVSAERGGPIYDPEGVSAAFAMHAAVKELVERGGDHASFAGVAVRVGAGGATDFSLLTPATAGPTGKQVDRFLAASGLAWPAGVPRNREAVRVAIDGPWRDAWSDWRIGEATRLQASLGELVARSAPGRRLWLLTGGLPTQPSLSRSFAPAIDDETDFAAVLRGAGVDLATHATDPSVIVSAPHEAPGAGGLADETIAHRVRELVARSAEPLASGAAAAVTRRVVPQRLAPALANDRLSSPLPVLSSIGTPSDAASLLAGAWRRDPPPALLDSSARASLLLDPASVALRRKIALALPANAAGDAGAEVEVTAARPLRVQTRVLGDATVVEVVNPLPWPVDAKLTIEADQPCSGRWDEGEPTRFAPGQHVVSQVAPPHSVSVCRFSTAGLRVSGVRSALPESARASLVARLDDLKRRDLSSVSRHEPAVNLSFEQLDDNQRLVGWEAITAGSAIRLTDQSPKEGAVALLVDNRAAGENAANSEPSTTLQTKPMPPPDTGQLAVTFHLRPESVTADTRVVVRIEEVGGDYVSSTTLGAEQLGGGGSLRLPGGVAAPSGWRTPYAFAATDVPIGAGRPIRVAFELAGEGRVAIDQIAVYDLVFPLDLGAQSTRQKLALLKILRDAESALERDDLAACYTILDGYWPRFLRAHTPLLPEAPPEAVTGVEAGDPEIDGESDAAGAEEPTEVGGGWRSYLPRFWR